MKRALVSISLAVSLLFLFACDPQEKRNTASKKTGHIAVLAQWPDKMKRISANGNYDKHMAPAGVVTVSVIVSGTGMSEIQQNFDASAGRATIRGVPAGTNRTVTLQGLDSSWLVRFEGSVTGITISAGQTTDCGTVVMNPTGSIPPPTNVTATAGDGQVTINWDAVSGAESYNIYMRTTTGVSMADYDARRNTVDISYTWTELISGTTYYFVVTTESIYGQSTESAEVSAMPPVTWAKTYGGAGDDTAYDGFIQQTFDGGYIVCGHTDSFGAGDDDILVLKLNADGTVDWQETIGGTGRDGGWSIQQTGEEGYIMTGSTDSFGAGDHDILVLKLNADGTVDWRETIGGTGKEFAYSIQQTLDGGYIICGGTESFGAGGLDIWVLKLNANGVVTWQKTYGGTGWDSASSIQQTADTGYIVAGRTDSFGAGDSDIWVLKLNADGTVVWQKTYGGIGGDSASSIQQTADAGYIVAGDTYSFGAGRFDIWVLKLNADGVVVWQKTYGGKRGDNCCSIQQTTDAGYIVAGYTYSFGVNSSIWVLKLNADGAVAWQKTYGGTGWDNISSIQQTTDAGYIFAGHTDSFGAGGSDIWVLKIGQDGYLGCGFGVDSSAILFEPGVNGSNTDSTVSDTAITASHLPTSGQNSTAVVETQCQ